MAVIAVVAAGNMRWVLADCGDAVMAGTTSSQYLGVIDYRHWREHARVMTVFTNVRRLNVSRVFADRLGAIVTVYAIARDGGVVELCR